VKRAAIPAIGPPKPATTGATVKERRQPTGPRCPSPSWAVAVEVRRGRAALAVISGHNPQNSGETLAIGELECVVDYRYGEGG
jgi:hypothetical protein